LKNIAKLQTAESESDHFGD